MEDKTTLEHIRKGSKSAFEKILQRYYTTLCAFSNHIVKDKENAEDIVQELFVKMWTQRNQLENIESIKDYLFTCTRNHSLTFLRNQKRRENHLKQIPREEEDHTSAYLIEEETNRLLLESVALLPPRSAEVISLGLQGMKQEKIAQQMNISINTVKSLKYEAIQKLRDILGPLLYWFFFCKKILIKNSVNPHN